MTAAGAAAFEASAAAIGSRAQRFAAAALSLGADPLHIELRHAVGSGFALHAARAVSAGECVLRVPRSTWEPFSCERALAEAERVPTRHHLLRCARAVEDGLGQQGVAGAANFARWVVFTVNLLQPAAELTDAEQAYADFLPRKGELDVPLLWEDERVALLEGSPALHQINSRRGFTAAVHEALFGQSGAVSGQPAPVGDEGQPSSLPLAPVPPEDYCWATSVLLSRATSSGAGAAAMASQRAGDAPPFTLVPVMDCLNHALEPNCEYAFDVRCPGPHSLAELWS